MTIDEFLDWPGDGSGNKFELADGEPRALAWANSIASAWKTSVLAALTAVYEATRFYRGSDS